MNFKQKIEKLKNDSEFKKILTNINWLFLDKGIQMGVAFFVSILVIRYLGPEQYGIMSYVVAMVAFFSVFSRLGLDGIVVRELVNDKFETNKLLGTVFYLKLFGGFVAVILATLTSFLLKGDLFIAVLTAIISFSLVFQSSDVIDYWFQSKVVSKYVAYSRSIACVFSAVIKLWLIYIDASLVWFVGMVSVEALLVAIGFNVAYLKNKDNLKRWKFDVNIAKNLLKDSWPLILSSFAIIIYMRIDQIMIGNILDYEALGNYSVAANLSEIWYFVPVVITTSVFPAIIEAKKHSNKLYHNRLYMVYGIVVWIAIISSVVTAIFSDQIIEILYGKEYSQASDVLMVYVWASIFVFFGVVWNKFLLAENKQKMILMFDLVSISFNIVLNMILIPIIGIVGAAIATASSMMLTYISFFIFYKEQKQTILYFVDALLFPIAIISRIKIKK